MKITPIPTSNGIPSDLNPTAHSPDRMARAKAIAAGDSSINIMPPDVDPQVAKVEQSVRRIKMKTNATTNRPIETPSPESLTKPVEPESTISAISAVPPVIEDTKPLDPQFAALAKQRRALQVKERELLDKEKALAAQPTSVGTSEQLVARLKSEPLSVLQEHGVTYDQLTEAILANQSGISPEIHKLREELKALKEGVDKTLSEKDTLAEQQVLAEIQRDVAERASEGDQYEMIRETRSQEDVKELIHRTFKETGEILDVSEAMELIENELVKESLKLANIGKVRNKLTPKPTPAPLQQQPQKQIRTLTNRDNASHVTSRRDRAIAAALGNLKR